VHSLHVSEQISLQVAFELTALLCASVLIGIVNASMLCQLVARVELFAAHVTFKPILGLLAEMHCLVLLQQEVEVKLLIAVVAVVLVI